MAALRLFGWFLYGDRVATTWLVIFFLVFTTAIRAQEPVRTSSGQSRIGTFRRAPEAFFYLGPFQEELAGLIGVQYNDNVDLSATKKISDLSFTEGLTLNSTWVISQMNQLQFNFGGALIQNFYSNGRSQLNFSVAPNSILEFKFDVGDYQVRLFDAFSYIQNPTSNPTATNTANLNSLTNTIGAQIDKDFNVVLLSLLADFTYNNQSGTTVQGQNANQNNPTTTGTRETFRIGPALTLRLSPTILYGLNAVATRSTGENATSVNSLNFGPFINGKLSRNFEFELAGGGTLVETKPPISPSYYFSAAMRYLINRHWQLLASASHELIFTTGTDLTEQNLIRIGTQMDLTRFMTFTISPYLNFGDVETNNQAIINTPNTQLGAYTLYGVEAGLTCKLRRRLSAQLVYSFTRRHSETASTDYQQNTLTLSFGYAF